MNYPMKDGQIDPEFLEKVFEKADNTFFSEVEDILKAAQQVMEEMKPPLKNGDKVKHKKNRAWGIGKVTAISASGKSADVYFEHIGFSRPLVTSLTKIEEAQP